MHVQTSVPVRASVDAAWPKLADLAALASWMPGVKAAESDPLAPGAVRKVTMEKPAAGKQVLVERVAEVGDRWFRYEIVGGIGPLREIWTTWRLVPDGEGGRLVLESEVKLAAPWRLLSPLVRMAWRRRLRDLAAAFASYADRT